MTPIPMSQQMREADRTAIEEMSIPGLVLMENAARGAFDQLQSLLQGDVRGRSIAIICGTGNNGGDGLALARHALIHGADVACALLGDEGNLSPDASAQFKMLAALGPDHVFDWKTFQNRGGTYDAIVDGMLGTGAHGELRQPYADAVAWANERPGLKFALDIPTGIDADTGRADGDAFVADATATMGALKPGLLLNRGAEYSGLIHIVHIGAPPSLYETAQLRLLDDEEALTGLPEGRKGQNKYDRGKVLVLAGSKGMTGAGTMTAEAALRSGAGLVVYAMPEAAAATMPQRMVPEIMTRYLPSDQAGAFAGGALDQLGDDLGKYSAIAVGPGLSKSEEAARVVRNLLVRSKIPVVLDADGLSDFTGRPEELLSPVGDRPEDIRGCPLVITPHHGEMARLLGCDKEQVADDPVAIARQVAARINGIVVLKGAPTVVAFADGRAWINSVGNPGMATGGTGDVLTGMIASLIGQTGDAEAGTLSAVYLHSLAGDLAAEAYTEHAMTATDIIAYIPEAYRTLLDQ
jgi:NAD(P)H-hydrate epimerase